MRQPGSLCCTHGTAVVAALMTLVFTTGHSESSSGSQPTAFLFGGPGCGSEDAVAFLQGLPTGRSFATVPRHGALPTSRSVASFAPTAPLKSSTQSPDLDEPETEDAEPQQLLLRLLERSKPPSQPLVRKVGLPWWFLIGMSLGLPILALALSWALCGTVQHSTPEAQPTTPRIAPYHYDIDDNEIGRTRPTESSTRSWKSKVEKKHVEEDDELQAMSKSLVTFTLANSQRELRRMAWWSERSEV